MSLIDETLRLSGRDMTILRGGTGITSTIVLGDPPQDPMYNFERSYIVPSSCPLATGDLIQCGNQFFLAMSLMPLMVFGEYQGAKGMLYRCNNIISIYGFNQDTKRPDQLIADNVHCLSTRVAALPWPEDKSMVVKHYSGTKKPLQVFMQASSGLEDHHVIVDANGYRYRVGKDFDIFIAGGILQTQLLMER